MSVKAISAVFEHSNSTIGSRLVLLALADRADDDGYCFPSLAELARKTLLSRRGVTLAIQKLEQGGEIRRARRLHVPGNARERKLSHGQVTTAYEIVLPGLASREQTSLPQQPQLGKLGSLAKREGREIHDTKVGKSLTDSKRNVRHTEPSKGLRASRAVAPEFLVSLWNEHVAGKVKPVGEVTPTRRRLVQRVWIQHPDPGWWRDAITRAYQSRFLRGAKGWVMTFNWFVGKDNAVQVLEGVHDNKPGDFPQAEERVREIVRATRGYCRHVPTCADQESHVDRLVDRVLGIDVEPNSS